ncbi:MAG TPA: response regulator [Rhodothermales bacterium]|nr:response regulator [Rhodothermales bacterium]
MNTSSDNVLIIEDSQHLSFVLAELLQERGLEAATAKTGNDGLRLARELSPQLILSDYNLPEITGLDVLKELQADASTADIPFILVTAHGNAGLRDECLEAGAKAVLFKPFAAEDLFEVIAPYVHGLGQPTGG